MGLMHRGTGLRLLLDAADVHPASALGRLAQAAALSRNAERLAKVVQMLELKARQRLLTQGLFALPKEDVGQGLLVGRTTDGMQLGGAVRVDPGKHLLLAGQTGAGKSFLNMFLVGQHLQRGGKAWVFDLEREFSCLLGHFSRKQLWWMTMPWLVVNILRPPMGVDLRTWSVVLVELLRAIYFMKDGGASLARTTLHELYERHGCCNGSGRWPTISSWRDLLRVKKFAVTSQFQGHLETLTRVVTTVEDLFPAIPEGREMPLEVLAQQSVIFDVAGMSSQDIEFLVCLLLHIPEPAREVPRLVVIEECHIMLNPQRAFRSDLGEPPLQDALRRQRKASRSFLLVDQTIGELPGSVIANMGSMMTFGLRNLKCQQVLGAAMGLNPEQKNVLMKLPPRVAIVHTNAFPEPMMVQIPELAFRPALSDEVVKAEMRRELAGWWPDESPEEEVRGSGASKGNGAETPNAERSAKPGTVGQGLSLDCLRYLQDWNEPELQFLAVTAFDQKQGLSLAKGNALRAALVERGLIVVREIKTGRRGGGLKTVEVLEAGCALLEEMQVKVQKPAGKGVVRHGRRTRGATLIGTLMPHGLTWLRRTRSEALTRSCSRRAGGAA